MEFDFCGEFISETGLGKVAAALNECSWRAGCSWQVELRTSGYDGSQYLRTPRPHTEKEFDFDMDSGQTPPRFLFGGGVRGTAQRALALLGELSRCLASSRISHRVEVYDESQEEIGYFHFQWPHGQSDPTAN